MVNDATTVTDYVYDANDRLLDETVNQQIVANYTYDNNGNTLTKTKNGITTEYTWDYENRLIAARVKDAGGVVQEQMQYRYNDRGIRVAAIVDGVETRYLIDEIQPYAQVLEEYSANGTVQVSYVYGNRLISQKQGGARTFYHVDGLGSTRSLSDTTGNVVNSYNYDAFGEQINSTGSVNNKYLFAGEQFDSQLGDYYLRARYYDTETGRFTRRDTYEGSINNPVSLHKYIYAHDNPINFTDPTGLASEDPVELSKFGSKAERAIVGQYINDPEFAGDNIYSGEKTSIGCGVGKNKALCPDILNYDKKHYMEVKPFTPSGRKAASESMGRYKASLQPEYQPNTTWKAIPNIGNVIVEDGTPIIYLNDTGVLFYTNRVNLYEAIIALSALGSAKRRSKLKEWREGGEPDLIPSPAFQPSISAINQDYIQQITIALVIATAAAAATARYGFA